MSKFVGTGPRLIKKEFTRPRSHKGWETLTVGIVNAFDDIWSQEFYYNIASVNTVHVSRSGQHCAVALQSWRYVALSNGFYFTQYWHRINPFCAKNCLQSTCI